MLRKNNKSFLDSIFSHNSQVKSAMGGQKNGGLNNNKNLLEELFDDDESDEEEFDINNFTPNLRENGGDDYQLGFEEENKKKNKMKMIKSVKIEAVITTGEAYGLSPHPNLLRPPFSLLIIAPKGSGKTTTTINLLKFYENAFDNRIAFSPTMSIDDNWKAAFTKKTIKPFNKRNMFKHYNEAKLCKIWKSIKKENKGKKDFSEKLKTLILFDDIVGELPRTRSNCAYKIARNHRHYAVSAITISQEYCGLAPVLRKNATGILLYGTTDGAEIKTITQQQGGFIGTNRFFRMWCHCISKPYGFLFINKDQKDKHRYFCYFEKELNPLDFSNERVKDMVEELENALGNEKNDNDNTSNKEIISREPKEINKIINGVKEIVIEEKQQKDLHKCNCKIKLIKDINQICPNGLNLLADALHIENTEEMSKEDLIKKFEGFSVKMLKKVLSRQKKILSLKNN